MPSNTQKALLDQLPPLEVVVDGGRRDIGTHAASLPVRGLSVTAPSKQESEPIGRVYVSSILCPLLNR